MNIVKNVPIKKFLELSNKCEIADKKLKQLEQDMSNCFKKELKKCDCSTPNHNMTINIFNEQEFDSLIETFAREIPLVDKFRSEINEYLNYQLDVDIKVYMNMVETINKYIDRKLYHKTLVTTEEKEKYAKFVKDGITKKRNI